MSLPTGGAWPPSPYNVSLAQQAVWSAWYTGDPEGLSSIYGSASASSHPIGQDFFGREGGILPAVARFFWGRPSLTGQRKARLHVPLAADIATASGDLLFSEPPQFLAQGELELRKEQGKDYTPSKVQAHLDEHLNTGSFHAYLLEAAELCAALGGGWLRLVWDADVADRVMVDSVPADSAYGEWRWGVLQAVTFFTEYIDAADTAKSQAYRHLERHEPGRVLHGLYLGDAKRLGRMVPLVDHPSTALFADLVDEDGAIPTGVKGLTAAYVANIRPQRRWRKVDGLCELGRSDYDGVEPLMDALDETYTSWMRDVRLAKARIIVPEFMLTDLGKGKGAGWDEDQEVFTRLNIAPNEQAGDKITPQQFAIRVQEHADTARAIVQEILRSAGYSGSTFDDGQEAAQTATEVVAKERTSARTRDKKTRYWSQALEPLLTTWLELDALVFKSGAVGAVEVQWPDASQPDMESLSRTVNALNQAEAISTLVKVRMLHPDWSEEEIAGEVEAIKSEHAMSVPDLGPLGGGVDNGRETIQGDAEGRQAE
jgi:A118 family predicted phage portal protein